jgi:outer membrane protein assembly factor BamB
MLRKFLATVSCAVVLTPTLIQAQSNSTNASALARLNLKSEWTANIPIASRQDGLLKVQVVDENQVFVQTRNGALYCIDAKSGRELWKYLYPSKMTDGYAVAVNEQFVYSVNVSRLYCHQRFSGVLEFEIALPESPASGPVVDDEVLFIPYTGAKLASYELPPSYRTSAAAKAAAKDRGLVAGNPADSVYERNASRNSTQYVKEPEIDRINVTQGYLDGTTDLSSSQASPSITMLQSVLPPYTTGGLNKVVSVSMLPSLKAPYSLKPDFMQFNQISPSVSVMPPSVARLHELSNLRPPPFSPKIRWITQMPAKVYSEPVYVPANSTRSGRLWVTVDTNKIQSVARDRGENDVVQQIWRLDDSPSAPIAGPFQFSKDLELGVLTLKNGEVLGFDLSGGTRDNPRLEFRASVGGTLNRKPVIAQDGVYVGGDNSGLARINVNSGEVDWRTPLDVDRFVAITNDSVYAKDRRGNLLQFAKGLTNDRRALTARPLAALSMPEYSVPVSNDKTDRVFLASESGELICLRDNSAQSVKAKLLAPVYKTEPVKAIEAKPAEPMPPAPMSEPKKPMEPESKKPAEPEPKKPSEPDSKPDPKKPTDMK